MNEFPSHWSVAGLGEIATIKASNVDKKSKEGQREVILCNYMDVFKNPVVSSSLDFMKSTASEKEISEFSLSKGDVLLTKDSEVPEEIGIPSVVAEDIPDLVCGYHLYMLRADRSRINRGYLCWALRSNPSRQYFYQMANGSTRFGLNLKHVEECPIAIPPLPEQKKIAEILSGIDTAINKIATAIVKSDTALTGIFAELDLIAAAGKISTLGEIARVQNGYAFQSSIFTEDSAGIPLVRISNISGGLVDTSKSKRIPQTLAALGEYKVSRGDILIAMSGATTGKIGIYHGSSFCLLNQRVGKFVFRPGSKSIAYATQLLLSGFLESRILAKAAGGAQPNISGKGIEAIEIPFPDTAEQDKYAITIQEFLRVNAKRRILMEKYQHLKSALSSDLLSGRKRVSI